MKRTILLLCTLCCSCLFAQQTISTRNVKTGLSFPWEILWGKDNSIWMTERGGKISKINPADGATQFSHTISEVVAQGEGGLLGMVQHPDFLNNGYLYVVYNYNKNGVYTEKVVRFTYSNNTLGAAVIIMDDIPAAYVHNGSRLLIVGDKLFLTTGDATNTGLPQSNSSKAGKVLRLNLDGSIPADNPVAGNPMWSKGHRNQQGLVYANGILYSAEHGPDIEDEVNIIEKNRNYGWPNVNGPCDGGETNFCNSNNVKGPLWSSGGYTIAMSGLDYYNNDHLPNWKNSLLLVTLKDATFYQIKLSTDGLSMVSRQEFFRGNWGRLRDVAVSPSGKVYICTSNGGGNDRIVEVYNSAVPAPNQPPVANAGADKVITLPTNTTSLTGTATDADGTIATYAWSKVSGPAGGTIATANAATTNITALQQGVYVFRLTVTDDDGATDTDDVQVTVNAAPVPNQPPVANAGADKVITLPTNTTSLTGTATDA
ncbi:MAG: PQQ-dependent sugar dehydrogenase, partial [Chitinophagaceae bacterium]|nr:PQQ-dependent sugar dehydrogenase [Chitinophagaceae bacterium]